MSTSLDSLQSLLNSGKPREMVMEKTLREVLQQFNSETGKGVASDDIRC